MLVSAISANSVNGGLLTAEKSRYLSVRGLDVPNDESCENCSPNFESIKLEYVLNSVYDDINMWKHFCHEQILQGKLDIIA